MGGRERRGEGRREGKEGGDGREGDGEKRRGGKRGGIG